MNHQQPEEQIRELLDRYIKGECTAQEAALLERWYDSVVSGKEGSHFLNAADEERLVGELRKAMSAIEDVKPGRVSGLKFFRHAAIWAGWIVLAGGAAFLLNKRLRHSSSQQSPAFIEIATGYEQVRKVTLPDNSVVWLNSATHLAYHPDFAAHRELRLSGEAFFEVAPDAQHPFIVKAGNAYTRVFGTAFNISAYPEAGQWRISLKSGKVGVLYDSKVGKKDRVLKPGELLIYDKEADSSQIEQQAPGEMDVWTAGRLLFYKTPLKEALAQIEARYGVHIVYDHVLKNQTITARFENTALEKVLEHLSFGWDLHFIRTNDTLHVR